MRYERYRAKRRTPKDLQTRVIQKNTNGLIDEVMRICVAYSAFLSLIILTTHYLLHDKFILVLSISAIVIIITYVVLTIKVVNLGLKFIKNVTSFVVIMTFFYICFEAGLITMFIIPLSHYIYYTLIV